MSDSTGAGAISGAGTGRTDTKQRIMEASTELFRRQGFTGTGLKRIVAEAEAPFGSLYHFFPGGKTQLGEEVVRASGGLYMDMVTAVIDPAPDIVTGVSDCFSGAAEVLKGTDYADACPIATIALEVASTSEPLRVATADVFEEWTAALSRRFGDAGLPEETARSLSLSVIALLEGAFILSRARKSTEPLLAAGATASAAVRAALGAAWERGPHRRTPAAGS
jgi:AcrR family transcriptional regulator